MNLSELFPYHAHRFTAADGTGFTGWLAESGAANIPGLSPDWQGSGMNLWTQDLSKYPLSGIVGGTVTDEDTGTVYLITGATRYDDYADGGAGYWLLQVKESRAGR